MRPGLPFALCLLAAPLGADTMYQGPADPPPRFEGAVSRASSASVRSPLDVPAGDHGRWSPLVALGIAAAIDGRVGSALRAHDPAPPGVVHAAPRPPRTVTGP